MRTTINAHDYTSLSPRMEAAMDWVHREKNDASFQNLVCTFASEACREEVKLFVPANMMERFAFPKPIHLVLPNGQRMIPAYTDKAAALACGYCCTGVEDDFFVEAIQISLWDLLEKNLGTKLVGFNFGLPNEIILPPQVHHTVHHLMYTQKLKTIEPAGSSWTAWVDLLHRHNAAAAEQEFPAGSHMPETILELPIASGQETRDGAAVYYHLK